MDQRAAAKSIVDGLRKDFGNSVKNVEKKDQLNLSIMLGLVLLLSIGLQRDLQTKLSYPTGGDQDTYLVAGKASVEQLTFQWRSPLYSAWLGAFYLLSGRGLAQAFYLEKRASVLILSLLVAILGYLIIDARTGLLMGIWILNAKYFVNESNGSHALVASLFTMSLLFLLSSNESARLPVALLTLFLTTLVRIEMWLPFVTVLVILALFLIRGWSKSRLVIRRQLGVFRYWVCSITLAVCLSIFFSIRAGFYEPPIPNHAFIQNFSVNYIERKNLLGRYPEPWGSVQKVWEEALPGATNAVSALKLYPGEVAAHVLYNVKLMVQALPASVLAFERRWLMLTVICLYLLSYFLGKQSDGPEENLEFRFGQSGGYLLIWIGALFWLVLITLIYRVAARYYIPLLPALLTLMMIGIRPVIDQLSALRTAGKKW